MSESPKDGSRPSSPFQPPVSQERAILETFFHALSQFAFDKAKDQVEKERDSRKTLAQMSMWVSVLNSLSHLASAEKIYFSLAFIARKFFRKDLSTSLSIKKSLFSSGPKKQMETPFLYLWISKLHAALVSKFTLYFYPVLTEQTTTADMKFTLYFYPVLTEQTTTADMKVLTARATVDYIAKITAFQRRSDALNVSVLLDARGLDSYSSDGYHFPQDKRDQPAGLGAFPAVVSFPGERPLEHWPNIISIMMDRAHAQDLASAEKVVYFFDNDRSHPTWNLLKSRVVMFGTHVFVGDDRAVRTLS
ncbi:predicted protein [Nematostella vectensis]|uniref:Uncharacterized protein n=1 Tax=Nematostella vectensis TaxID=45351 RepID=A7T4H8_NEMVE|nr:predicted protein [Nematostella vectensis]|eukprot:XP_001621235.1 hypothetical protein NEMVEDRAFT_v1g222217 [Nematostella vectensis]